MKPRFHRSRLASFTLALTSLALLANQAAALTYYWDNDGTTAGFGTAGGTWTAPTVSQWSTDSTGVATPGASITTTTSDALNFGTASAGLGAGTITVSGTVNANTLTFGSASGAIVLSGGIINLGGTTPTITVNNAADTISSEITGTAGLFKAGSGVLTLSGVNSYTGTTVINDGKIIFTNSSAFGTSSVISVRNTSSLEFGANGLDLTRNVQIQNSSGLKTMQFDLAGTNTGTLSGQLDIRYSTAGDFFINTGADDTLTVSGRVYTGAGGGAGITKTGDGTLILSATNNSYVGVTTVSAGVLNIQHGSALGSVSHSTSVTSGAALQIQGGITTLAEALTLNGTGISNDGALRNISGDNTYAGAITLNSATRINSASGTLTLDVATGNAITGTQNLTFGGAGNITVADAIATSTGTLTKDGAGTLTLSGANTYTGATTISAGTLQLGDGTSGKDGTIAGASIVNNANLTYNRFGTTSYGGVISGTGTVTKLGDGTQTLTGTNTYTGGTTVSAGTLRLVNSASGDAIRGSDPAHDYVVASGATLEFNRTTGGTENINRFNLSGAGTFKTSGTLGIVQTSLGSTVAMGSGALFHVESGSYQFGAGGLGDWSSNLSDMQVDSGATFDGAATPTVIDALNGSGTVLTGGGITLGVDNGSGTFSGVIGNSSSGGSAFSITKAGSGTQTLSGANTYTGSTTVSAGTLKLQGDAFFTQARNYSIASDAVLNLDAGAGIAVGTSDISGNGTLLITGGALVAGAAGRGLTLSLGSGALIDIAAGGTMYNGGWSAINWNSNLADLNVDGVLNVADGQNVKVDALTGSGTISKSQAGTVTLQLGVDNGSGTFSGIIENGSGAIAFTKEGSGTQTLTGTNTYTGATTVNAGTLYVNGALGDTNVSVSADASLGGIGILGGDLTFDGLSYLDIVDIGDALAITGSVTFGSGFGLDNITGWDYQNAVLGTYTLLSGSSISLTNMDNVGLANALTLTNGNQAYFQTGSLQVVIAIPEPSAAVIGGLGLLLLLRRRR